MIGAVGVAASALGPLVFAVAYDATGSYAAILLVTTVLPLAVAAITTPLPARARRPAGMPRR